MTLSKWQERSDARTPLTQNEIDDLLIELMCALEGWKEAERSTDAVYKHIAGIFTMMLVENCIYIKT